MKVKIINEYSDSNAITFEITASRSFWNEFIVNTINIKNSNYLCTNDYKTTQPNKSNFDIDTPDEIIIAFINCWGLYKNDPYKLMLCVPDGFLEKRIITININTVIKIFSGVINFNHKYWYDFIYQFKNELNIYTNIKEKINETNV